MSPSRELIGVAKCAAGFCVYLALLLLLKESHIISTQSAGLFWNFFVAIPLALALSPMIFAWIFYADLGLPKWTGFIAGILIHMAFINIGDLVLGVEPYFWFSH